MGRAWALDLGTTNTGLAYWDENSQAPVFLSLEGISRLLSSESVDELEAPRLIPSAIHVLNEWDTWAKMSSWRMFKKRLWGQQALIGRPAIDENRGHPSELYVRSWKAALMHSPFKTLAKRKGRALSAREIASLYLRELTRQLKEETGERWRDLVVTVPVDAYETYRMELLTILQGLGVKRVRFIDEPVAAALGYGLSLNAKKRVLVVDIGGGTAHAVVVELDFRTSKTGSSRLLSKRGRQLGGDLVDLWLAESFAEAMGYPLDHEGRSESWHFWWLMMLSEARRVKESVLFQKEERFFVVPPDEFRSFSERLKGEAGSFDFNQDMLKDLLERKAWYGEIMGLVTGALEDGHLQEEDIDDVLLTGGSTLLPGVFSMMSERFGRAKIRGWQPFEAVAFGAAAYAAGSIAQSDTIVHDYALVTHRLKDNEKERQIIIPKGTRIPTVPDFWKRTLVPTCALGEPESFFKLLIAEIGEAEPETRRFAWDDQGQLKKLAEKDHAEAIQQLVVILNEANPTLGELNPPHQPGDKAPRLELSFGVNEGRWLMATVKDLKTQKVLMQEKPVVKLL